MTTLSKNTRSSYLVKHGPSKNTSKPPSLLKLKDLTALGSKPGGNPFRWSTSWIVSSTVAPPAGNRSRRTTTKLAANGKAETLAIVADEGGEEKGLRRGLGEWKKQRRRRRVWREELRGIGSFFENENGSEKRGREERQQGSKLTFV